MTKLIISIVIPAMFMIIAINLFAEDKANPQAVKIEGIENAYVVSDRVLSGGTPENAAAFERLKKLGVTTIVSVDGARPALDITKQLGLKYIHLPVGYDGISAARQLELVKAMQLTEGKLFVHCHHGKHRGPAAVAIIERLSNGWSPEQARRYMEQAGTSPNYRGLWRDVAACQVPTSNQLAKLPKELPETVAPPKLVETMLKIDDQWEKFASISKGKVTATRENAAQLAELMKEWLRQDDFRTQPELFRQSASDMLAAVEKLERHLKMEADLATLQTAAKQISQHCTACHIKFRDAK